MTTMTDKRHDRIIEYLPVAARVARNHSAAGIPALERADLAATATLAVIRAVDDHDGRGDLEGYAGARAKHALIDELRKMRAGKRHHHDDVRILSIQAHAARLGRTACPGPAGRDPATAAAAGTLDIDAALGQLSPVAGRVIVRHYIQGQRLKDIAADLGCSPSRVSQIKKRALRQLEKILK